MTARDALRALNDRLRKPGFGPVVGPQLAEGDFWEPPPIERGRAPLDYAVGCVDPIEDQPDCMVAPAALGLVEGVLLGSIFAMGALALWFGFGG